MSYFDGNNTDEKDNLKVVDQSINTGLDSTLTLTTTPILLKVGVAQLTERTYVLLQALGNNIKWGFDTNCRFDIYKNQFMILPIGDAVIYLKTSTGTSDIVIAEGSA